MESYKFTLQWKVGINGTQHAVCSMLADDNSHLFGHYQVFFQQTVNVQHGIAKAGGWHHVEQTIKLCLL